MRHRIHARRKPEAPTSSSKTEEQRHSKLQPRPFPADSGPADMPTQSQQERIARPTPSVLDIPLYPPASSGPAASAAATVQARPNEANLKPPRGTLQRQAVDEKHQEEQLNLSTLNEAETLEDEESVQRQPAQVAETAKEDEETEQAIQAKEEEQEAKLQAKAEAEAEEEQAEEEVQRKEEEKQALQTKREKRHQS